VFLVPVPLLVLKIFPCWTSKILKIFACGARKGRNLAPCPHKFSKFLPAALKKEVEWYIRGLDEGGF